MFLSKGEVEGFRGGGVEVVERLQVIFFVFLFVCLFVFEFG